MEILYCRNRDHYEPEQSLTQPQSQHSTDTGSQEPEPDPEHGASPRIPIVPETKENSKKIEPNKEVEYEHLEVGL